MHGNRNNNNNHSENSSKCGRFQFQCHSGECIAVYNACDGIPQCVDGSDEGPECPGSTGQQSSTSKTNAKAVVPGHVQLQSTNNDIIQRSNEKVKMEITFVF